MHPSIALALFLAAGLPVALTIDRLPRAIGVGVLASVLTALLAAIGHVAFELPLAGSWAALVLASALPLGFGPARAAARRHLLAGWSPLEVAVIATVVLLALLLAVVPAPAVAWDARSIWFFHAKWLLWPGSVYLAAQTDPSVGFSHVDYPVAGPAAVAVLWRLAGGSVDLPWGIRLVALLNLGALAFVVLTLAELVRAGRSRSSVVIAVVLVVALSAIHPGRGRNNGYVDVLLGLAVAGVALLLARIVQRRASARDLLALAVVAIVAVNVKQEGLPFVLAGGLLAAVFVRRPREVALIGLSLAPAVLVRLAWQWTLAQAGSPGNQETGGIASHLGELLDPTSEAWRTFGPILWYLVRFSVPFLALAAVGLLAVRLRSGPREDLRTVAYLATCCAMVAAIIVATYSLTNGRAALEWWFDTSFVRINATLAALAIVTAGAAVLMHLRGHEASDVR